MAINFNPGDLVRVKSGIRQGKFGRIVEKVSEQQDLYQVEFPNDSVTTFFFEDEIERAEGIPCPKCIQEGKWVQLSDPYWTKEGWTQDCSIHGRLYLWGWFRAEEGEVIDLLTGESSNL